MTYKSILVGIDIDAPGNSIIALATEMAARFHARLIGASAADIAPPIVTPDGIVLGAEIMQNQRDDIESRLSGLRRKFETLAGGTVDVEWRGRSPIRRGCCWKRHAPPISSSPHRPMARRAAIPTLDRLGKPRTERRPPAPGGGKRRRASAGQPGAGGMEGHARGPPRGGRCGPAHDRRARGGGRDHRSRGRHPGARRHCRRRRLPGAARDQCASEVIAGKVTPRAWRSWRGR